MAYPLDADVFIRAKALTALLPLDIFTSPRR